MPARRQWRRASGAWRGAGYLAALATPCADADGRRISTHTQREAMVAQLALEKQHLTAYPAEVRAQARADPLQRLRLRAPRASPRAGPCAPRACSASGSYKLHGRRVLTWHWFAAQEASELASYLHSHLGVSEATAAAVIRDIQSSENSDNKMLELHAKCVPRTRCCLECHRLTGSRLVAGLSTASTPSSLARPSTAPLLRTSALPWGLRCLSCPGSSSEKTGVRRST